MRALTTKTRYVGTCQICEGRQKLEKRGDTLVLVHHGYKRPGDGAIHGDCFGVHYQPYENAHNACENFRDVALMRQQTLSQTLAKLEGGEIRTLTMRVYKGSLGFGLGAKYDYVTVSADAESATERYDFERELFALISSTKSEIRSWKGTEECMVARIAAWPPATKVVTFGEHAEELTAERRRRSEAVTAERAARKAAQAARLQALVSKRAGWEQEKRLLIERYRKLFLDLASDEKTPPGLPVLYWTQMYKAKGTKGYLQFYPNNLRCDDELVKLGLAKITDHGLSYATAYGAL